MKVSPKLLRRIRRLIFSRRNFAIAVLFILSLCGLFLFLSIYSKFNLFDSRKGSGDILKLFVENSQKSLPIPKRPFSDAKQHNGMHIIVTQKGGIEVNDL